MNPLQLKNESLDKLINDVEELARAVLAEHCEFAIIHGAPRHARNWLGLPQGVAAIGYSPRVPPSCSGFQALDPQA